MTDIREHLRECFEHGRNSERILCALIAETEKGEACERETTK